jgi:predicted kinase
MSFCKSRAGCLALARRPASAAQSVCQACTGEETAFARFVGEEMTVPPETSSLLSAHRNGRLSRAHIERFAAELALCHARMALEARAGEPGIGYSGKVGLILQNVFLHEGQMILHPLREGRALTDDANKDVWSDVASMVLELEMLGQSTLGNFFLAAWLEQSGAFDGLGRLRSHIAREALLFVDQHRAAPAPGAHVGIGDEDAGVGRALRIASERQKPVRPGSMIITHGLSGAGKTTLATALAGLVGALVVRNDVEHIRLKRDHAVWADDPALGRGTLIDRLEMLTAPAIDAGWPVIVESCFLDRANRQRFRAKAAELGAPFAILECSAPLAAIRERLHRRRAFGSLFHGEDASADDVQERLQAQLDRTDPLDASERAHTITVDTGKQIDHQRLANWVLGLSRRGH